MGLCGRPADPEEMAVNSKSRKLMAQIVSDSSMLHAKTKLLLLGAGESGKSTIFKQMRLINSEAYSEKELAQFKYIIHRNVLDAIKTIIEECHSREIMLEDANEDIADQALLWENDNLNPQMADSIAKLWADPGIQRCFDLRAEYQLGDNAASFLGDVQRIGAADYLPTTDDALRARVRTSGVVSKEFILKKKPYLMYDVGGQRSERHNWLPLFDHVSAMIFVCAISEYDKVLAEDRSKNRMHESLELFTQVANSKHFSQTDIIIFFNKKDLFAEKIKRVDPKEWFPEYKGGCDFSAAEEFFKELFRSRVESKEKTVYTYTTCATDTGAMEAIFLVCTDMLLGSIEKAMGIGDF